MYSVLVLLAPEIWKGQPLALLTAVTEAAWLSVLVLEEELLWVYVQEAVPFPDE